MNSKGKTIDTFSSNRIDLEHKRLTKTYVEYRGETNSPHIEVVGKNVYLINWLSEHNSHERCLKALPDTFPHIYNYHEQNYLSMPEHQRPPIPEPIRHRDPSTLMLCTTEMDYLPYANLSDNMDSIFTPTNIETVTDILRQWFTLQLSIIKHAHVLPWDLHTGNLLYDTYKCKLYVINYGFYEFFNLIERDVNPITSIVYRFDPVKDKRTILKDETNINTQTAFTLSNEEVENLFMTRLPWFANFRNTTKLHYIITAVYGINKCVDLHTQIMRELNFSTNSIDLIREVILNGQQFFPIMKSLKNWRWTIRKQMLITSCFKSHEGISR